MNDKSFADFNAESAPEKLHLYVLRGGKHDGLTLRSFEKIDSIGVGPNGYKDLGDVDENGFVILQNATVLGLMILGNDPLGGDGLAMY